MERSRWHSITIGDTKTYFKPPKNDNFNVFDVNMEALRSGAKTSSRLAKEYNSLVVLIPNIGE